MNTPALDEWARSLPLGADVDLDGATIRLTRRSGGAELSACLIERPVPGQIADALAHGFASALFFDAGLACDENGRLLLTQWLPGVNAWAQAIEPLARLLEQAAVWQSLLLPAPAQAAAPVDGPMRRQEEQLRRMLGTLRPAAHR